MQKNSQFLRTNKVIKQTFISLLNTKPYEKITIQDILIATPVTRSTFYKHYHNKLEIFKEIQQEYYQILRP